VNGEKLKILEAGVGNVNAGHIDFVLRKIDDVISRRAGCVVTTPVVELIIVSADGGKEKEKHHREQEFKHRQL
jgi:hypothetical protein